LNIYKKIAVAATSIVLTSFVLEVNPAQAVSFEFTYRFLSGNTVSGTLDGDLQPGEDRINNLTNLEASYSGVPEQVFSFFAFSNTGGFNNISFSGDNTSLYGLVAPMPTSDETVNIFGFLLRDLPDIVNSATVGFFGASRNQISAPFNSEQIEAEIFSPERWTLQTVNDRSCS